MPDQPSQNEAAPEISNECKLEVVFDPTALTPESLNEITDRVVAEIARLATGDRAGYLTTVGTPCPGNGGNYTKTSFGNTTTFNQTTFEKSIVKKFEPLTGE